MSHLNQHGTHPAYVAAISGVRRRSRNGLTLIELLVVIAIIGILIAMLLPAVQQVRESARRSTCLNNIRQLALASHSYESNHQHFPPGVCADGISGVTKGISPAVAGFDVPNWIGTKVYLLPYLEQNGLDGAFKANRSIETGDAGLWWDSSINNNFVDAGTRQVSAFLCPSDSGHLSATGILIGLYAHDLPTTPNAYWDGSGSSVHLGRTNYMSCSGVCGAAEKASPHEYWGRFEGIFTNRSKSGFDRIADGTTNTIAFGEQASNTLVNGVKTDYSWTVDAMMGAYGLHSGAEDGDWHQFKSQHAGNIVMIAMGDGSARAVGSGIDEATWHSLCGCRDGHVVSLLDP